MSYGLAASAGRPPRQVEDGGDCVHAGSEKPSVLWLCFRAELKLSLPLGCKLDWFLDAWRLAGMSRTPLQKSSLQTLRRTFPSLTQTGEGCFLRFDSVPDNMNLSPKAVQEFI